MATTIQIRGDHAAAWVMKNPILAKRELGYELESPNRHKLGDGQTRWNDLNYAGGSGGGDDDVALALQQHILSENPHPNYDDGIDLVLRYENAKV
jgi:hypothetical protein